MQCASSKTTRHRIPSSCKSVIPTLHASYTRCLNTSLYITSTKQINYFLWLLHTPEDLPTFLCSFDVYIETCCTNGAPPLPT
jgi:hypothetical protein